MSDNNTYVGGNVSNAAIGANAKNQSDNVNSFNTTNETINPEQKAAMCEVIDEALKSKHTAKQIMTLATAREALENADEHLPQVDEPQTNSLLQTIWQGIKELDAFASSAERATKYIAPVVTTVLTFLA